MLSTRHFIPACLLMAVLTVACDKSSNQPTVKMSLPVNAAAKRYPLKGKVISVDKRANMVNVDGEDIPGFMGAMTMPYPVKPPSELDKLSAGDAITADVVVQDDNAWLENIVVSGKAAGQPK